ncbi:unnamed protein product [Rhizoctonia solani]|uniref:Protein kinase domain-containing protein n=1 Tax=Rhizoctonia solani TaxID=456999 RepID=A0A8H3H0C9_9AGAM|nr:unnamed protein product [Rhizoctonia solani]
MWALLEQCWDHDPAARPVASQVTTLLQTLVKETELSHESNNGMFNSLTPQPDTIIHPNKMSTDEMFQCLTRHGCPDLAKSMNPNAYSRGYIASGGSGDIWKGELRDKTAVAIKVWRCGVINEDLGKDSKRAMREIYNWSQLNHDNIQKLLGVVVFDGRLGMVSKWMENGNLRQYLERNPHVDRYPLCMQVVQGMEYLHHRNMIHGDLKATSILVSPGRRLKLTNFDHSIMAESTLQFSQTTRMGGGTLRWMVDSIFLTLTYALTDKCLRGSGAGAGHGGESPKEQTN